MMQVPPHSMLLPRYLRRTPTDETKYIRMEFGEKDSAWFATETAHNNGHGRSPSEEDRPLASNLPNCVCVADGRAAEY